MNYRRVYIPGAIYFFTINLKDRKSNLLVNEIDKLRNAFRTVKGKHPFGIEAIVILPDHIHLMMSLPKDDEEYPLRIRLLKSMFTYQLPKKEYICQARANKMERGIWQRRYWEHLIRDEKDYIHHWNYIMYNPVRHGYVERASDWIYSSIHREIRVGNVPADWACGDDFDINKFGE
jgi:putative transposase